MSIALRGFLAISLLATSSFAIACPLCDRGFDESKGYDEGYSPRKKKLQFFSNEPTADLNSTTPIKEKKAKPPRIKNSKKKAKPTKPNDTDLK